MKILYIITQADGGGAQKYVLTLAKYFKGAIAAGDEAGKLFEDAKTAGLTVYPLKHLKRNIHPWHDFWAVWEIRQLIKRLNPDIVHLNSTKAGFLGSLASIGLKTKTVFTAHGFRYNEPFSVVLKNLYVIAEKIASRCRDYIITVSKADEVSALARHIIGKDKITTIYNGIEQINFLPRDEARKKIDLLDKNFLVGILAAGFYKTKAIDVLIDAAKLIDNNELNDVKFIIMGYGPEFAYCKQKINNLNLNNYFILTGNIDNANALLKAFDVFVLPSRKEGFPFALLEAMQASLPIVASRVGGIPEALGDAGIVCAPENPKALAEEIRKLITDGSLRKQLSDSVFERSKLFTKDRMLEETKKVYEKMLN